MNLSDIKTTDISEWNNDQICAALVEAKKIEKLVDFMKETLRERIENDTELVVSNGKVKIGHPSMLLSHDVTAIDERFLLNPIRPLNKTLVRAHMTDSGGPPVGVTVKWSKKTIRVTPTN
tara:strand:- start:230 stop:589 length:360 start_codon:yes stop_codon:yes gene_type:complete